MREDICPYCFSKHLYKVTQTSYKCSKCKKKYSIKKLQKDSTIMDYFCDNISANECAKTLNFNYKSVKERYMDFRKLALLHLEEIYTKNSNQFSEYDEYYFLPKHKRGKVKYLFDAIGILGMVYNTKIYTILLTDQFSHIKQESKDIQITYIKEYAKYLNRYKIVHFEKFDSLIIKFWVYLEKNTLHYKGVSKDNFIYYLKECEFKFNFNRKEQKDILWKRWLMR